MIKLDLNEIININLITLCSNHALFIIFSSCDRLRISGRRSKLILNALNRTCGSEYNRIMRSSSSVICRISLCAYICIYRTWHFFIILFALQFLFCRISDKYQGNSRIFNFSLMIFLISLTL